ncbi:hypothetical protein [Cellulomonas humilata]|uniref:Uncharacterized protein n=1 Tax=Cellulomonas humilata TaxID=144055 RepID=A0ABU0EIS9_9CELL|nr:hypothetical protein [Cellulomonas humilata]MDQ0375184.1 hypothetical protein [Cellulomonas humilata]
MNRDLESALGELADRVELHHGTVRAPLPVDRITALARRHRRTRAAWTVAGAAAAVVLVAGTAFALLPDPTPAPPAVTSTPTPTPTPTVTSPTSVVLPTGDPALPFGTCGALVDAAPAYPVDDRLVAWVVPDAPTLLAGGTLPAGGVIDRAPDSGFLASAVPDGGPRVAVLKDGVVVGTAGFYPATYDVMAGRSGNDGELTSFRGPLELVVCDPGDGRPATVGRPLPAGTYELRPWASVVTYDDLQEPPAELFQEPRTLDQAAALGGTRATAVGEPVTITVTGEAETQPPLPGSDVALDRTTFAATPACEGPAPVAPVRSAMLDLQVFPAATVLAAGSPLHATATVLYTGPGRFRAFGYYAVEYWVVRDGVVVGTTVQPNDAFSSMDLGAGAVLGFADAERVLTSCRTDGGSPLSTGDPLPAGEYTVYPAWIFTSPVVRTLSEVVELQGPDAGYSVTLGTPFPVTLT